jgi:hypothetical protein
VSISARRNDLAAGFWFLSAGGQRHGGPLASKHGALAPAGAPSGRNELLEQTHGERLEHSAPSSPGRGNSKVAAMAKLDRAKDCLRREAQSLLRDLHRQSTNSCKAQGLKGMNDAGPIGHDVADDDIGPERFTQNFPVVPTRATDQRRDAREEILRTNMVPRESGARQRSDHSEGKSGSSFSSVTRKLYEATGPRILPPVSKMVGCDCQRGGRAGCRGPAARHGWHRPRVPNRTVANDRYLAG